MFETQIIGNLGKDAETRQSDNGSYTIINVCYSKKYTNKAGVQMESKTWIQGFLNGECAGLKPYLTKGRKVYIRGELSAKPDNKGGVFYDMRVEKIELLGSANNTNDDRTPF